MTRLPPENQGLALVGYRGTGKSTVGKILADRLGRPFADADKEIEQRLGRSIRSIFAEDGEPSFRDHEKRVLAELTTSLVCGILATGGGAVLSATNRQALRDFGFVVWLKADPETLALRISSSQVDVQTRPALTSAGTLGEIEDVLRVRTPLYLETSHASVETTGRSLFEVADAVLDAWAGGVGE